MKKFLQWKPGVSTAALPAESSGSASKDAPNLVQSTGLKARKLHIKPEPIASRRLNKLAMDLTKMHSASRYTKLGEVQLYPGDPSTKSTARQRLAVDENGYVRTLRSAKSFTSFTTTSEPLVSGLPDSLKTSVESVLRDVVYVGQRRFRGTNSGLLETRNGPNDLEWKPCDTAAPRMRAYARPVLGQDGRAYVVRDRREVVELGAKKDPQQSLGGALFKSRSPIMSLTVDAKSHGFAMLNETAPGQPPAFALLSTALTKGKSAQPVPHPVVLGDGEAPAHTPERPCSTLAVASDQLLMTGAEGGLYSVPLASLDGKGGSLVAQSEPPLAPESRMLGFAHVHDGKGGTALHALAVGADGRLSSFCWSPSIKAFEPGEDFGASALLYATTEGSRRIEVPAHRTLSLDGKGTDIGIVDTPDRLDPAVKPHQLLFRDTGQDWKPFESKYAFHQLGVAPANTGRAFALVQEGSRTKRIAELVPQGAANVALGVSFGRNLADAGDIQIKEAATTHEPERFAAAANGAFYYTDRRGKLYRHSPVPQASELLTVPMMPIDAGIPLPPGTKRVHATAVDNLQRLHVLADGQLFRYDETKTEPWIRLDPGLGKARLTDLTHNRLGDLHLHVTEGDRASPRVVSYRLDDSPSDGRVHAVDLSPPPLASVAADTDSVASESLILSVGKNLAGLPGAVFSAAMDKFATMRDETFPALMKLVESFIHGRTGHAGLKDVYDKVKDVGHELALLAQHDGNGDPEHVSLAQFMKSLGGTTGNEARGFADRLLKDLEATLRQLDEHLRRRNLGSGTSSGASQRELLRDLKAVVKREAGGGPGEPGHAVMQKLQALLDDNIGLPYTGLDMEQARAADDRCGLIASRAAMLAGALAQLRGLHGVAPDDRLGELRKLVADHEGHLVKRATDFGFTSLRELENAYSARAQIVEQLGDPASPQFRHAAHLLDRARELLTGPTTEPTMTELIDQLKASSGATAAQLRQQLVESLRRGLIRYVLNNTPGDITTLNVERGVGVDAFGALFKGGTFQLDASAVTNFDYAAIFRTRDDGVSLELSRTKSYDANLGGDVSASPAVLASLGGELRGSGKHASSAGAEIKFPRAAVARVVSDFLDAGKSLFDVLSLGTESRQLQSATTDIGGSGGLFAKAGTLFSMAEEHLAPEQRFKAIGTSVDASARVGWSKGDSQSRVSDAEVQSGTSVTKSTGTSLAASGGGRMSGSLTVPGDGTSEFMSLGTGMQLLPTKQVALRGEGSAGIKVEGWGVPSPVKKREVLDLLNHAPRLFPNRALTITELTKRVSEATGSDSDLVKRLQDIATLAKEWETTSPAAALAFLDEIDALRLRHQLASRGVRTYSSAAMEIDGSSLEQLKKKAPHMMEDLAAAAQRSLELSTYLDRAGEIPDVRFHFAAELKPSVHRQAQELLLKGEVGAREEVKALCDDARNYRLSRMQVTGTTDYTSHANFAPVLLTVGGGSGASAQVVKGSIRFMHGQDGIAGFSASRSLRQAHETQDKVDHRMGSLFNQKPVLNFATQRHATTGQTRQDRQSPSGGSSASESLLNWPLELRLTSSIGSGRSTLNRGTIKGKIKESPLLIEALSKKERDGQQGSSSASTSMSHTPDRNLEPLDNEINEPGTREMSTAAAEPPPLGVPAAKDGPSWRGAMHKVNKVARNMLNLTPPKSRKNRP